jgi:hypothetical protein
MMQGLDFASGKRFFPSRFRSGSPVSFFARWIILTEWALIFSLVLADNVNAQEKKLDRFILSNSTISESRAPLYMAQDLRLFEKYGLDGQIVNIRGSAINNASLMAGEIQMALANGTIAITAAARRADCDSRHHRSNPIQFGCSPGNHFIPTVERQNHWHRRFRHRRLFYLAAAAVEARVEP